MQAEDRSLQILTVMELSNFPTALPTTEQDVMAHLAPNRSALTGAEPGGIFAPRLVFLYYRFAQITLLITAFAKLIYLKKQGYKPELPDPVFGFASLSATTVVAVCLELAVVILITFLKQPALLPQFACGWLGACFVVYHLLYVLGTSGGGCPCLGILSSVLGLSVKTSQVVSLCIAIYLTFALFFRQGRKNADGT